MALYTYVCRLDLLSFADTTVLCPLDANHEEEDGLSAQIIQHLVIGRTHEGKVSTEPGGETSYREHNLFLPMTKSKSYVVGLLYYSVAVCIYNIWCILNAAASGHGRRRVAHVAVSEARVSFLLVAFIGPTAEFW